MTAERSRAYRGHGCADTLDHPAVTVHHPHANRPGPECLRFEAGPVKTPLERSRTW